MAARPIPVTVRLMPASYGSGNGPMRITLPAMPGQADGLHIPGLRKAPALPAAAPEPARRLPKITKQPAAIARVLRAIADGHQMRADIARATGFGRGDMDQLMSALAHRGLIACHHITDTAGRKGVWRLTPAGDQHLRQSEGRPDA